MKFDDSIILAMQLSPSRAAADLKGLVADERFPGLLTILLAARERYFADACRESKQPRGGHALNSIGSLAAISAVLDDLRAATLPGLRVAHGRAAELDDS